MTRPLRLLSTAPLAALAAALLLPVGAASGVAASPAIPDMCGALDLTDPAAVVENARGTDDVFIGRVTSIDSGVVSGGEARLEPRATDGTESTQPADPAEPRDPGKSFRHEVLVEDALAGDLRPGEPVRIVFTEGEGEPAQLRVNATYVFFTQGDGAALEADGCNGYASARGLQAAQVDVLREALAPEDESADVVLSEPEGGSDGPPDLGRVLAPGGAVILLGVLGLVLISRVGRGR